MKKKRIWLIVLILVIVFIFINVLKQQPEEIVVQDVQEEQTAPEPIALTFASSTKTIQAKTHGISFDFPVTNSDDVNNQINQFVENTITSFVKDIEDFGPSPVMERQYTMYSRFDPYVADDYTTFVFLISVDTGGAHPNHTFTTFTFDQFGEVKDLDAILSTKYEGKVSLEDVAVLAHDMLLEDLGENAKLGWIDDGTEVNPDNFKDFYLTDESLVLLFEPYAIGPYAWSSRTAEIQNDVLLGTSTVDVIE